MEKKFYSIKEFINESSDSQQVCLSIHPFFYPLASLIHSSVHPSSIPHPPLLHFSVHPSSTPLPVAQSFPIPPSITFVRFPSTLSSPLHLSLSINSLIHSPPILPSAPPLFRYLPVREMSETLHMTTLITLNDQTVPLLTCISFCFAADTCIATSLRKSTYRSLKVNQGE